jgi:hypothetical protein
LKLKNAVWGIPAHKSRWRRAQRRSLCQQLD